MRKIKNILLMLAAIGIIFLAGEVTVRLLDIGKEGAVLDERMDYRGWQPDPVLNRAHVPGIMFTYVAQDKKEFRTPVKYNRKGLNDAEISYLKPEGSTRILVFGDSFVEAIQVKREQNFCEILEERLNAKAASGEYEVLNMGVSGYSPILEYIYLRNEGLRYDPDVVILCFFMNDVYEDSVYKGLAVFGSDGLPLNVRWQGIEKTKKLEGYKLYERRFTDSVKSILNKSRFYRYLKERVYRLLAVMKIKKSDPAANPFFVLTGEGAPDEEEKWNDTFRYILAMKDLAEKNGARFIFVTIPLESQLVDDPKDAAYRAYFYEKPVSGRAYEKISRFCGQNGIQYINLLDEFRSRGAKGLYFRNDGHFNVNGHREVSSILYENIFGDGPD